MSIRKSKYQSACLIILIAIFWLCTAAASSADTFDFLLTDGTNVVSFSLPSDGPADFTNQFDFGFLAVPVTVNGAVQTELVDFPELSSYDYGGLTIGPPFGTTNLLLQSGPQLFNGAVSQPEFALGNYTLANIPCPLCAPVTFTSNFTLTIRDAPEPSTIAFLLGGFVLLPAAFRLRNAASAEDPHRR